MQALPTHKHWAGATLGEEDTRIGYKDVTGIKLSNSYAGTKAVAILAMVKEAVDNAA